MSTVQCYRQKKDRNKSSQFLKTNGRRPLLKENVEKGSEKPT